MKKKHLIQYLDFIEATSSYKFILDTLFNDEEIVPECWIDFFETEPPKPQPYVICCGVESYENLNNILKGYL